MKLGFISSFDAAHSLPAYEGKCKQTHGHTYKVEVVVEGDIDPRTHFVIDYFELRQQIEEVLSELDHTYLNDLIPYPSSEHIAQHIHKQLEKKLKDVRLVSVKLWEGDNKWVMID